MEQKPDELQIAECLCSIFTALETLHGAGMRVGQASKVRREAVHFLWELREGAKLSAHRPHSVVIFPRKSGRG
jgi:hypothetical protein